MSADVSLEVSSLLRSDAKANPPYSFLFLNNTNLSYVFL